jgi:hypothetical protein
MGPPTLLLKGTPSELTFWVLNSRVLRSPFGDSFCPTVGKRGHSERRSPQAGAWGPGNPVLKRKALERFPLTLRTLRLLFPGHIIAFEGSTVHNRSKRAGGYDGAHCPGGSHPGDAL